MSLPALTALEGCEHWKLISQSTSSINLLTRLLVAQQRQPWKNSLHTMAIHSFKVCPQPDAVTQEMTLNGSMELRVQSSLPGNLVPLDSTSLE